MLLEWEVLCIVRYQCKDAFIFEFMRRSCRIFCRRGLNSRRKFCLAVHISDRKAKLVCCELSLCHFSIIELCDILGLGCSKRKRTNLMATPMSIASALSTHMPVKDDSRIG